MHKLFCIIGRTGVGKSHIAKGAAEVLDLKVVKSYTTRPMRKTETKESADHIFIKPEDVEQYRDQMIAYTVIDGNEYFTTIDQLRENDIYVIDPFGVKVLQNKLVDFDIEDIEVIPIYVSLQTIEAEKRFIKRGGTHAEYVQRYKSEHNQFADFERDSNNYFYNILNNDTPEYAIEKLIKFIRKEWDKLEK